MSIKLNCFDCKLRFNVSKREPIIMFCCGNTACREYVTSKMIKSRENAERGIANKGEFECSGCQSKCYNSIDTDLSIPIQVNNIVKAQIA